MSTAAVAPIGASSGAQGSGSDGPHREAGLWYWLWFGISAGLLAVLLGIGAAAIAVPRFTGSVPLTVLSSSMEPSLPAGTLLIVRPLELDQMNQVRVGDVISYQPNPMDPTLVTHRVTGITSYSDGSWVFTTQGDANDAADDPVYDFQVRAKLWYSLPHLGWVSDAINGQGNRVWIIPAAAGALFAYTAYSFVRAAGPARRKDETVETHDELDADGGSPPPA